MKTTNECIRKPEIIALDVTYKCNLYCLHCFNFSGQEKKVVNNELTDKELLKIAGEIIELAPLTVCLCGGEPILRGDIIFKLIEKITNGTNNNTKVNMVTNGQAITLEIAKQLKDSGLYNIQVSLDGPDSDCCDWIRNKEGAFDKAILAIKNCVAAGLDVSVACCPTKKNYKKIEETIELANSLGVKNFRVQPLMSLGRAQDYLSDWNLTFVEYKKIVDSLEKYKIKPLDIKVEWGDPIHHLVIIATESDTYYPSLSINAYGDLNISPYIPISFGNAKKHSIVDYWNKGLHSAEKSLFYKEICKKITSTKNMDISKIIKNMPQNYMDKSLEIDLIDNPEYSEISLNELILLNERIRLDE